MASPSQKGSHQKSRKWELDFTRGGRGGDKQTDLMAPVGYTPGRAITDTTHKDVDPNLVVKRGWDIALGPVKQLPMNLFIMWMAGNTISIFPIMMVGMMAFRPIQALATAQTTFKMIEGPQAVFQKLVYLLGNVLGLVLALYKCQTMGLLPTHASDWLAFAETPLRMEWSGGGMVL